MKSALLILALCMIACGHKDDNSCRSKEHMRLECQAQNIPTYGYPHATEICSRYYESDRCY